MHGYYVLMKRSMKIISNVNPLAFIGLMTICLSIGQPVSLMAQGKADEKLASMFFRDGNYEKAAALYGKLYDEDPRQHYYTYYLFSLIEVGEFKDAEKLVRRHLKRNNDDPRFMVDLGYLFIRLGNVQSAYTQFDDAIKKVGGNRSDIINLSNAFLVRQQLDYALKTYERGRKLNKEYGFHLEMAQLLERLERFPEMVEEYLTSLEVDRGTMQHVQGRLQQSLANDPDLKKNDALREALLRRVQRNPDLPLYGEMLLWHAMQQKDFELALIQAKALDKRYNEGGMRVFELAGMSAANEDYTTARQALEYVIARGPEEIYYTQARIDLLNVRFIELQNTLTHTPLQMTSLESEYMKLLQELGKNAQTLTLVRNLARLQAFHLYKTQEAIDLLSAALLISNIKPGDLAESKLQLGDIYLFSGEVWEATLLYSQVEKAYRDDALGHQARFSNARLSFFIGEFNWAKSQLDILKAATSKLIANDAMQLSLLISDNMDSDSTENALRLFAQADLYLYRNMTDSAMAALRKLEQSYTYHALFDDLLMKKSEIMLQRRDYQAADSLLALLLDKYPQDILADDALYQRGVLQEEAFKDKEKAMAMYERLLFEYPGSLFVIDARKRYRHLRGDLIN